jgi:uncharacterized membrane protein YukC
VLIVSGLCVAGIATAGLGLLAAAGYLFYAIYQGSQRKKLLVSDLNAYLEKLENQVASRIQAPSPAQVMQPAQTDLFALAEVIVQEEEVVQASVEAPAENAVLNSDSVRRALSRKL